MSWVTASWSMLIGACIALALPHLLLAFWGRRSVHWFFILAALAVTGIASGELLLARARDPRQFVEVLRWMQVPIFLLTVGLVGFVYSYLRNGRLWLAYAACGVRFVCLVVNFVVEPNLNFRAITALRHVPFLHEQVAVPIGVLSPWTHLAELSSALVLIFVIDASVTTWRQGKGKERQAAVIVGGSITFFILMAAGLTAVTHRQIMEIPYMVSFPFAAIVIAMTFEVGSDLFQAGLVAQKLEQSEAFLHESEERFTKMADASPVMMWMSGQDKLCSFVNKAWLEFTGRESSDQLGNGWTEGVHADDLEKCWQTYAGAFDRREPFVMQYRLRNSAGEYRWITDKGVPRYGAKEDFRGYIGALCRR